MKPLAKLGLFALLLLGAFVGGAAVGSALPDLGPAPATEQHSGTHP